MSTSPSLPSTGLRQGPLGRHNRGVSLRIRAVPALAALMLVALSSGASGGTRAAPHVTMIGDSVATAILGNDDALRVIRLGNDIDLELSACRRLVDRSCAADTQSTVEVIRRLGSGVGPTVVIAVGYNDFEDHYADEINDTLAALDAASVKHVFWLTLRAAHHPYVPMNDAIAAAASRHPGMTVIDWNVYSRSHPDWFQADGIHLFAPGSLAMASLIHDKLVAAGIAARPVSVKTAALPAARRRKAYRSRLAAAGGLAPMTWSLSGRLPVGLHLRSTGAISGTPRGTRAGRFSFLVRVQDAAGQTDTRKLILRLR
jgi:hypothetical protein